MITRRDFGKLSMSVVALVASGRPLLASSSVEGNAEGIDPRRVGRRALGTYWGACGEHIDLLSGNLNFSTPVAGASSRVLKAAVSGSYNSQLYKRTSEGVKFFGADTGYGFGWRIQVASIRPRLGEDGGVTGYTFIDGQGSEYALTKTNDTWVSLNGHYATWDASTSVLSHANGSTMKFGSVAASQESDAGSLYPTTLRCPNGNVILIEYATGRGAAAGNTSSRIVSISDAESVFAVNGQPTYSFGYDNGAQPKLTAITCNTVPGHSLVFGYTDRAVVAPFEGGAAEKTVSLLTSITRASGTSKTFEYNRHGELTSVTLERGGVIAWEYETFDFAGGEAVREVRKRTLFPNGRGGESHTHTFERESSDSSRRTHSSVTLSDGSATRRIVSFVSDPSDKDNGLSTRSEIQSGTKVLRRTQQEWSRTSQGTPYVSAQVSTLDPDTSDAATHRTETRKDEYGNTVETRHYDSTNPTAPPRIFKHSYLKSPQYLSSHILNRKLKTTVEQGASRRVTHELLYDSTEVVDASVASHHGAAKAVRGNPTESIVNGVFHRHTFDKTGLPVSSEDSTGASSAFRYDEASNRTRLLSITPNGNNALTTHLQHSQSGLLIGTTSANGASNSILHDALGRVSSVTDARGVTHSITRDETPCSASVMQSSSTGAWHRRTVDGLGRVVKSEAGDPGGTKNQSEHVYGFVAGHPSGKTLRSSAPHAPAEAPVWVEKNYDGLGRLISQTDPGGTGTHTIAHSGNGRTVTDGAGRWRKVHHDAAGRISKVVMPGNDGVDHVTKYSYDLVGHLTQVSMPRPEGTQVRNFAFDDNGRLATRKHAESGSVQFAYNTDGTLQSKMDAKGQKEVLVRDGLKRVIGRNYFDADGNLLKDMAASFFYDVNPFDPSFSQNVAGKLAAAQYGSPDILPGLITEQYSYTSYGAMAAKRVTLQRGSKTAVLESSCTFDDAGRAETLVYPQGGPKFTYSYDSAGRLAGIATEKAEVVRNVAYSPVGKLAQFDILASGDQQYLSERHEFDAKNRMVRLSTGPSTDSAGQNTTVPNLDLSWAYSDADGRVSQETDHQSNTAVNYSYDSHGRLATASSSDGAWGLSYAYDGFGNRTHQKVTQGQAYEFEAKFDPATNWMLSPETVYDANGNLTSLPYLTMSYDARNRLTAANGFASGGTEYYSYDLAEHRIWKRMGSGAELFFFYLNNQRLATYRIVKSADGSISFKLQSTRAYFGGRVVRSEGEAMVVDRLGANRAWSGPKGGQTAKYLPFGEQLAQTSEDKSSFGTYEKDATGLDYAWHRYYSNRMGRFATPDPCEKSVRRSHPDSWNRYAFACNDPLNRTDFDGLYDQPIDMPSNGMQTITTPTVLVVVDVNVGTSSQGTVDYSSYDSNGNLIEQLDETANWYDSQSASDTLNVDLYLDGQVLADATAQADGGYNDSMWTTLENGIKQMFPDSGDILDWGDLVDDLINIIKAIP